MKVVCLLLTSVLFLISCDMNQTDVAGTTSITKWPDDKKSAISITYDDGTIHQFTVAMPIMNALGLKGTFYIITGKIKGSARGKFIGRPIRQIIAETAETKTDADNFFERASAIGFSGSREALGYHSNAGSLFESGKIEEAYTLMDEGYEKLRKGELLVSDEIIYHESRVDTTTWDDYLDYARDGHEIASHTVTHPRLAVLDEVNMLYELEQSKADIIKFLGEEYTFSAECPYGTEDERVMEYAHKIYPSLRNRMPEPWLEELNRGNKEQPGTSDKEYVQWQRGPLTNVSMETMKSWVDTCLAHDNIWLVLVFHGVDGIGWEPRTGTELQEYFTYIKEKEPDLWVATFADVTKYLRERKNTEVSSTHNGDLITISLTSGLDPDVYNVPVTLKTYIPQSWSKTSVTQDGKTISTEVREDSKGKFVLFSVPFRSGTISVIKA